MIAYFCCKYLEKWWFAKIFLGFTYSPQLSFQKYMNICYLYNLIEKNNWTMESHKWNISYKEKYYNEKIKSDNFWKKMMASLYKNYKNYFFFQFLCKLYKKFDNYFKISKLNIWYGPDLCVMIFCFVFLQSKCNIWKQSTYKILDFYKSANSFSDPYFKIIP